jgi:glycosyltransferase involved in cell wall biosynthesis
MRESSKNILVSVIIPVYNGEQYISETIESVLNQTIENFELIIVNDGSTDGTLELLKKFQNKYSKIKIIDKPNSGVSDTRNIGIIHSNGKYVALLDADDIWLKENLEKKITLLESEPDIDFVYSDMFEADENLKNIKEAPKGKGDNILKNILEWNGEVIPGPASNLVIRKKSLIKNSIKFHTKLSNIADQHFTSQLAKYCKGRYILEPLWIYRVRNNSMSKGMILMESDCINLYKIYEEEGFFTGNINKNKCYSNMYLILAGSWWKNGKNKKKGIYYMIKSFKSSPFNFFSKIIKKLSLF